MREVREEKEEKEVLLKVFPPPKKKGGGLQKGSEAAQAMRIGKGGSTQKHATGPEKLFQSAGNRKKTTKRQG